MGGGPVGPTGPIRPGLAWAVGAGPLCETRLTSSSPPVPLSRERAVPALYLVEGEDGRATAMSRWRRQSCLRAVAVL